MSPIRINHWQTNGRNKNKRRKSDLSRYTGGTFQGSMASALKRYIRIPSYDSPCTSSTSHPPHTLSLTIHFNAVVWFPRIFLRIILFVDEKKFQVFVPSTISLLGRYDIIFFFNLFPFITPPLSFSTIVQHSSAPFHRRVSAFLPIVLRCQISPGHGSRVVAVLRTPDAHRHPRHNEGVGFYSNAPLSDTSSTTQTSSIVRFRNRTKSGNSVFLRERRRLVAIIDLTFFSRRGIELAELVNSDFFLP